tara:strand:+ start:847 stop:1380 length:534 start_codon:yes stop_codon:yes gene_type:complete
MERQNRSVLLIFGTNLLVLTLLGYVNSRLGGYGFFLYAPGLFFLPGALYLDNLRGMPLAFLTGLMLDQMVESSFGFHAFVLCLLHLLGSKWVRGSNYRKALSPIFFQVSVNLFFFVAWLLWIKIFGDEFLDWTMGRWLGDLVVSSLILVPLAIWMPQLCRKLLVIAKSHPVEIADPR